MNILGSHSPLHHSSLNSGKSGATRPTDLLVLKFYFKHVWFLCSHPYSSAVVPWQNNQRRIPSHHPPAGASRRVGFSVHWMWIKAKKSFCFSVLFWFGFFFTSLCSLLLHRLFLVRVSQSNPKAFVLTLCHHQKIKHFQILPVCTHWCLIIIRIISITLRQQTKDHLKS